jgi:hypothetical protein
MIRMLPLALLLSVSLIAPLRLTAADAAADHPRLVQSLKELKETIAYLQAAPNDFGGHKADAIAACKEAIVQIRKALGYRDEVDSGK